MSPTAVHNMRVPLEMLCNFFIHLSFADRVQASHVCRTWRDAALAHPGALWSHIISNGNKPGVLAQLLERAQDVPVNVEVLLTDDSLDDSLPALRKHLHHIRTLRLKTSEDEGEEISEPNIHLVYRALAHPAPLLTSFAIWLPPAQFSNSYAVPTNLFAGEAPELRQVSWSETQLDPRGYGYPVLRRLTHYEIITAYLSAEHISAIFSWLPALTFLKIVTAAYDLPDAPPASSLRLKELYIDIRSMSHQSVIALAEYFGSPRTKQVTTSVCMDWLGQFSAPPRTLPHTLKIESDAHGLETWSITDDAGYTSRCLAAVTYNMLRSPSISLVFERLVTLELPILDIMICSVFAPLPRLSRLVVHVTDNGDSVRRLRTQQPTQPKAQLVCPQLQTLELVGRELTWIMLILSADDVEEFVFDTLAFDPTHPPRVLLRNAALSSPVSTESRTGSGQLLVTLA